MSQEGERRPLLGDHGYQQGNNTRRKLSVKHRTIAACLAVLVTVILERIAFYGLIGNFVMFLGLSPLSWNSYNSILALFIFTGLSYMTALFGGWIADTCLGKYKTIVLFLLVYTGGYVCMPLLHPFPHDSNDDTVPHWCGTHNHTPTNSTLTFVTSTKKSEPWADVTNNNPTSPSQENCAWLVYIAIAIIAIGNGSVKANIAPFGADQV